MFNVYLLGESTFIIVNVLVCVYCVCIWCVCKCVCAVSIVCVVLLSSGWMGGGLSGMALYHRLLMLSMCSSSSTH